MYTFIRKKADEIETKREIERLWLSVEHAHKSIR